MGNALILCHCDFHVLQTLERVVLDQLWAGKHVLGVVVWFVALFRCNYTVIHIYQSLPCVLETFSRIFHCSYGATHVFGNIYVSVKLRHLASAWSCREKKYRKGVLKENVMMTPSRRYLFWSVILHCRGKCLSHRKGKCHCFAIRSRRLVAVPRADIP